MSGRAFQSAMVQPTRRTAASISLKKVNGELLIGNCVSSWRVNCPGSRQYH